MSVTVENLGYCALLIVECAIRDSVTINDGSSKYSMVLGDYLKNTNFDGYLICYQYCDDSRPFKNYQLYRASLGDLKLMVDNAAINYCVFAFLTEYRQRKYDAVNPDLIDLSGDEEVEENEHA